MLRALGNVDPRHLLDRRLTRGQVCRSALTAVPGLAFPLQLIRNSDLAPRLRPDVADLTPCTEVQ